MKIQTVFFAAFFTLVGSVSMAAPGNRVRCNCYQDTTTLWPDGAAYKWVSGCASGRGSSPECLERRSRQTAALKAQCRGLIDTSCPNQPQCLNELEAAIENLSETRGIFPNYSGQDTKIVVQQKDLETYSGEYMIPGVDSIGKKVLESRTVTFSFSITSPKNCGSAKVEIGE